MQANYFNRQDFDIAPFFTPYMMYSYDPESMPMYNTKSPYTVLSYWGNPFAETTREESDLNLLCTQNITPELNLQLLYDRWGGGGMLDNEVLINYFNSDVFRGRLAQGQDLVDTHGFLPFIPEKERRYPGAPGSNYN